MAVSTYIHAVMVRVIKSVSQTPSKILSLGANFLLRRPTP